jgi:uncharacterized protein YjbI with pentapeptide repeats
MAGLRYTIAVEKAPIWHGARFHERQFSDVGLRGCDLRRSVFNDCEFYEARLDEADLRGAQFDKCRFSRASLKGTNLAFHETEYQRLRGKLQAAHEASPLPELPSEETRAALNDLRVRVRLKPAGSPKT